MPCGRAAIKSALGVDCGSERRRFLNAIEVVAPGRGFLHYSDCVTSSLPAGRHGLNAHRKAGTPLTFPPASVWRYTRQPQAVAGLPA